MLKNTITLAKFTEAETFCGTSNALALYNSLRECKKKRFNPLFIPETMDLMLKSDEDSNVWRYVSHYQSKWVTPSIKVKGKSKQCNDIVIYAHVQSYFTKTENFDNKERPELFKIFLERETPQKEFEKLLELEDNENVFVHDYSGKKQTKNEFELDEALEKTRISSLIGGKKRAEEYLKRVGKNYSTIQINDIDDYLYYSGTSPRYGNTRLIGVAPREISSWNDFGFTYFIGIKEQYPALKKAILDFNSLFEEVSGLSDSYVPEAVKKEFLSKLKYLILGER